MMVDSWSVSKNSGTNENSEMTTEVLVVKAIYKPIGIYKKMSS